MCLSTINSMKKSAFTGRWFCASRTGTLGFSRYKQGKPDLRKDVPKGRGRLADLREYVLWKYYMRK